MQDLSRGLVNNGVMAQAAHGFTIGQFLRANGSAYVTAKADSAADAEVLGMVVAVPGTGTFVLQQGGYVLGLSALTAGTLYYLSPSSAGAMTATEPTAAGQVSKPVFFADTTTSGWILHYRGVSISSASSTGWSEITSSATLAVGNRYYTNSGSLITGTLPATAAQDDRIEVIGKGAGGWKVGQPSGATIHGSSQTTTGTGGSVASQTQWDCVTLRCVTANTDWVITSQRGTLTVV